MTYQVLIMGRERHCGGGYISNMALTRQACHEDEAIARVHSICDVDGTYAIKGRLLQRCQWFRVRSRRSGTNMGKPGSNQMGILLIPSTHVQHNRKGPPKCMTVLSRYLQFKKPCSIVDVDFIANLRRFIPKAGGMWSFRGQAQ